MTHVGTYNLLLHLPMSQELLQALFTANIFTVLNDLNEAPLFIFESTR